MSVHRRNRGGWEARWREGERNRSRTFDRKRDADTFDAELRRLRRLGELDLLDAGRETLAEFGREWWRRYAVPNLSRKTLEVYAGMWDAHVLPRLGDVELRRLTPELLEQFRADLERSGVGPASVRKTLAIVQSVLHRAVVWKRIRTNPVAAIRKPPQKRVRLVRPLAPAGVEAIRTVLLADGRTGDAALVSVLAYAGLRPGEALALEWGDILQQTIIVERALALGETKPTKTGRSRTVRLLGPLAADLAEWRLASGRPPERALVFARRDGKPWQDTDWRNWRTRVFAPAVAAAKLEPMRPYDLRHSYTSLLIAEGANVVEIARQAGHAPTMALDTYGHVLEEFAGAKRRPAEARIREARGKLVRPTFAAGESQ